MDVVVVDGQMKEKIIASFYFWFKWFSGASFHFEYRLFDGENSFMSSQLTNQIDINWFFSTHNWLFT